MTMMNNMVTENASLSTCVAPDSNQKTEVKTYTVPIIAYIQVALTGYTQVYASGVEHAA